ncbi:MAG: DUF805 domain-containing protein [Burkholderiaceae bacterium]
MTSTLIPDDNPQPLAKLFSLRGRIGRTRYIAYTLGAVVGTFLIMLLAGYALMFSGRFGRMLYIIVTVLLLYGVLPILFTILTIKRSHDFNFGGWIALLLMVPIVNFLFWVIPGTRGENKYGMQPEREPLSIRLAAIILPILLIGTFVVSQSHRRAQLNDDKDEPTKLKPHNPLKPYTP